MTTHRPVPRRSFLVASGSLLSGIWRLVVPFSAVASTEAPAAERKVLTSEQSLALMSVARTLAPHDQLPDAPYALAVQAIEAAAAADAQVRATVSAGIESLGKNFAARNEAERIAALKRIEHSDFFQLARSTTLGTIYATPAAYAHFGYEGEAFSKGGYLVRGFNDLNWLPDVPLQDSGPTLP